MDIHTRYEWRTLGSIVAIVSTSHLWQFNRLSAFAETADGLLQSQRPSRQFKRFDFNRTFRSAEDQQLAASTVDFNHAAASRIRDGKKMAWLT